MAVGFLLGHQGDRNRKLVAGYWFDGDKVTKTIDSVCRDRPPYIQQSHGMDNRSFTSFLFSRSWYPVIPRYATDCLSMTFIRSKSTQELDPIIDTNEIATELATVFFSCWAMA
jgi:hypothetical protein